MSNDDVIPGCRTPLQEAASKAQSEQTAAEVASAERIGVAGSESFKDVGAAAGRDWAAATGSVGAAGARLEGAFGDVEAMSSAIHALNRTAGPIVRSAAKIAVDSNLLESLILSPATGAAAEVAVGNAAAQLTATLVRTNALAIITGTIVSTYALADSSLAASAGALSAAVDFTDSLLSAGAGLTGATADALWDSGGTMLQSRLNLAGVLGQTALDLMIAEEAAPFVAGGILISAIGGVGAELQRPLSLSFAEAVAAFGGSPDGFNPFDAKDYSHFLGLLGANFDKNFSNNNVLANIATGVQNTIGASGPLYDHILGGLVAAGLGVGLLNDGNAKLVSWKDAPVDPGVVAQRNLQSLNASERDLHSRGERFRVDSEGRIVPTDSASMFASLRQIDEVGANDMADIRIFTVRDALGNPIEYRVQIPSTQGWNPLSGMNGTPGDITSDAYAMWQKDSTALSRSVLAAMGQAGIPTGANATPVQIDGFSLGGITAATLASNPCGYNITEIHTAGSPIGGFDIPPHVSVFSLEATEDFVTQLDGKENPPRPGWHTLRASGVQMPGEKSLPDMLPGAVHDADRYGAMAAQDERFTTIGALNVPPGGTISVQDIYAVRKGD